jgi:hypothetical protein
MIIGFGGAGGNSWAEAGVITNAKITDKSVEAIMEFVIYSFQLPS